MTGVEPQAAPEGSVGFMRERIAHLIRAEAASRGWSELVVRFGEFDGLMYASASIVAGGGKRQAFRVKSLDAAQHVGAVEARRGHRATS